MLQGVNEGFDIDVEIIQLDDQLVFGRKLAPNDILG